MIHINTNLMVENFEAIKPIHINMKDIAKSLSLQCRFNGTCGEFYSVAEHSVLVTKMFRDRIMQKIALLHDAHEAYMGDIIRPVIMYCEGSLIGSLKNRLDKIISARFHMSHISEERKKRVCEADNLLLSIERNYFFPNSFSAVNIPFYETIQERVNIIKEGIQCLSPKEAEKEFLDAYTELF